MIDLKKASKAFYVNNLDVFKKKSYVYYFLVTIHHSHA